jgi:hypothetical protein
MDTLQAISRPAGAPASIRNNEHHLQRACVEWFRWQYRRIAPLLVAVPNGGHRSKAQAGKLKAEGVVPGVADLILFVPNTVSHALLIEMKTPTGRQSPNQAAWQKAVSEQGYHYAVVRNFSDFQKTIRLYLT